MSVSPLAPSLVFRLRSLQSTELGAGVDEARDELHALIAGECELVGVEHRQRAAEGLEVVVGGVARRHGHER